MATPSVIVADRSEGHSRYQSATDGRVELAPFFNGRPAVIPWETFALAGIDISAVLSIGDVHESQECQTCAAGHDHGCSWYCCDEVQSSAREAAHRLDIFISTLQALAILLQLRNSGDHRALGSG